MAKGARIPWSKDDEMTLYLRGAPGSGQANEKYIWPIVKETPRQLPFLNSREDDGAWPSNFMRNSHDVTPSTSLLPLAPQTGWSPL
jgi:hypothetical protein